MSLFDKYELGEFLENASKEAKEKGLGKKKAKKYTRKKFLNWLDDFTVGLKDQICAVDSLDPQYKHERTTRAFEDFHYFRRTYFPHYYKMGGKSGLQQHLESIFKRIKKNSLSRIAGNAVLGDSFATAAPRGFGKSTDVSLVFAIYCIVYDLKHYITLFSDAVELTETQIEAIKAELEENQRLKGDFPHACGAGKTWKVGKIVTNNNVMLEGFGSTKRVRGRKHGTYRVDLSILDDLENDVNVRSRDQRNNQEEWLDEAVENLGGVDGGMDIIYIGTILHRDSVLARKLKLKYWNPVIFRALISYPTNMDMWDEYTNIYKYEGADQAHNFYLEHKSLMDSGAVLLWDSVTLEYLMRKRAKSPRAFQKEQQNNPNSENQRFDPSKFAKISHTQMPKLDRVYGFADAKGDSDSLKSDYFAVVIGGVSDVTQKLYIFYSMHKRIKGRASILKMIDIVKGTKISLLGGDKNGGFHFYRDFLKSEAWHMGVKLPALKFTHHTDNKEDRMGLLEFPTTDGDIVFVGDHPELFQEMEDFPESEFDDLHDCLEGVYSLSKLRKLKNGSDDKRTNVKGNTKRFKRQSRNNRSRRR